MSALRLPSTASTPPHFSVKAADDGHPQDVLLVLRLGIVQDHRTVTVWAVRRERYGDLLIHPAANRSGGPLPVCRARLASRRLRVTFGFPLGKRCGASLIRSQRVFRLLPQALVLRQCALQLLLQGLDSPFEFLLPIRGANAIGDLHPFHDDTNAEICSELSLKVLYLLSYPLVNILKQPGRVCKSVMKVLIVGRGVVGTIYGWALSKAGIDVTHVGRKELARPHNSPPAAPGATFLLFTANWEGTAEIDRLLPRSSILWGYAAASGGPDAQGILIATVAPTVRFGMLEGSDPEKYKAVTELFQRAGFAMDIKPNIVEWLWVHHAINAGGIGICLWAGGIAEATRSFKTVRLGLWATREALDVVAARGVDLEKYPDAKSVLNMPAWLAAPALTYSIRFTEKGRRLLRASHFDHRSEERRV